MRFKPVPDPPESLAFVGEAQRAVPLVPAGETDCCARLLDRTGLASRDVARTWLTFLRALGLVEAGATGFTRIRRDPDLRYLRERFRERVFGADRVLSILAAVDGPIAAPAVFERFRGSVPQYERHKHPDTWETVWRERVGRLLEWAVLLEFAERTDDGYRPVASTGANGDDPDRERGSDAPPD